MAGCCSIGTDVLPFYDGKAALETIDGTGVHGTPSATCTGIEHSTVVSGSCDNIYGTYTVLCVPCINSCIIGQVGLCRNIYVFRNHRHVFVREELIHQCVACNDTRPSVGGSHIRHTACTGSAYQIRRTSVITGFHTVLTDRKNDFLHRFLIPVIVCHEHQAVVIAKLVSPRIDNFIGIRLGIFIIGCTCIDFCIQVETGTEQPVGSFVRTSERRLSRFVHIGFGFCQFGLDIVIQFFTAFFYRQIIVEMFFKRSFAEQINKVPIVQGTQEAHFGTLLKGLGIGLSFSLVEEKVHLGNVVSQAHINPFGTLAGRVP